MSGLQLRSPARAEFTSCGSLLQELRDLWDEIGESDHERDKIILQLEQECLDVYRRKVDQVQKHKVDLHQTIAEGDAEVSNLISILGESFVQLEKPKGALKEQLDVIRPLLDDLRQKREERVKEFLDIQLQIMQIDSEEARRVEVSASGASER